jgi:hypothetical protein
MQPTYIPWIGYFDLMDQADVFVFLDSVAFAKRSWQQRNRIKTNQGELLLTIPVQNKGLRHQLICETRLEETSKFQGDHLKAIKYNYSKSPYFMELIQELSALYEQKYSLLVDFNLALIEFCRRKLNMPEKPMIRSSQLSADGDKVERLVNICKEVGADAYLSALGSKEYIEENNLFEKLGIHLSYHHYAHPVYPQLHGDFLPYMSVLDLLFNVGPEKSLEVIRSGRNKN